MTDIVERLNNIWANDDHGRGCQGREYSCSCGFDNRTAKTAEDAATEISRLRQILYEAEIARERAYEALRWYEEQARLSKFIGGRIHLERDGGGRARAALEKYLSPKEK